MDISRIRRLQVQIVNTTGIKKDGENCGLEQREKASQRRSLRMRLKGTWKTREDILKRSKEGVMVRSDPGECGNAEGTRGEEKRHDLRKEEKDRMKPQTGRL